MAALSLIRRLAIQYLTNLPPSLRDEGDFFSNSQSLSISCSSENFDGCPWLTFNNKIVLVYPWHAWWDAREDLRREWEEKVSVKILEEIVMEEVYMNKDHVWIQFALLGSSSWKPLWFGAGLARKAVYCSSVPISHLKLLLATNSCLSQWLIAGCCCFEGIFGLDTISILWLCPSKFPCPMASFWKRKKF